MNEVELVKKYLSNQCSPKEQQQAIDFMANNKGNKVINQIFDEYWKENQEEEINENISEEMYNQLEAIVDSEEVYSTKRYRIQNKSYNVMKYAASILVLVGFSYFTFQYWNLLSVQSENISAEIKKITKKTSNGQKSTIILADGSKVILNSASEIRYPQMFSDSSRVIELDGEAFFEVEKDKKRPFIVLTKHIKTVALGTSFNINSKDDNLTKISLATGKVAISKYSSENNFEKQNEMYFLKPGEALSMNKENSSIKKSTFDADEDLLWKDGVLFFKNYSFQQIIEKLEPWYDVEFNVSNAELATKKYTGRFDNVSLEHLMKNVGFTLGFDFFINEKKATIIFNDK